MDFKNIELPRMDIAVFTARQGSSDFAKAAISGADFSEDVLKTEYLKHFNFIDAIDITKKRAKDDIAPCICLIASGGVEHRVMNYTDTIERPVYVLSMKGGNSLPAALEISAALIKRGKRHRIVHGLDNIHAFLKRLVTVIRAIVILRGYQAAVIGGRADWLVADTPDFLGIQHFWGINIKELAFDIQDLDQFGKAGTLSFESVTQQEKGKNHFNHVFAQRFREFLGSIKNQEEKYYKQDDYINSLNIFLLLMQIINQNHLSALSLNCFELTKHNMTACLALAALNDMGLPAACEGDSGAMVSMAVSRAVTGIPGFMANISDIDVKSGEIWLTHCTVAPNLCERFDFNTHFESGLGLAVQGDFKFGVPVTLFRLGGSDLRKYFISGARMLGTLNEPLQCRTKARIMMDSSAAAELMTRPLGNHIIMIPGRHAETLSFLMEYKEMLHD